MDPRKEAQTLLEVGPTADDTEINQAFLKKAEPIWTLYTSNPAEANKELAILSNAYTQLSSKQAQALLGTLLSEAGLKHSASEPYQALPYFRQAAEMNHSEGMYFYARTALGLAASNPDFEAEKANFLGYLQKAAASGHDLAKYDLVRYYTEGRYELKQDPSITYALAQSIKPDALTADQQAKLSYVMSELKKAMPVTPIRQVTEEEMEATFLKIFKFQAEKGPLRPADGESFENCHEKFPFKFAAGMDHSGVSNTKDHCYTMVVSRMFRCIDPKDPFWGTALTAEKVYLSLIENQDYKFFTYAEETLKKYGSRDQTDRAMAAYIFSQYHKEITQLIGNHPPPVSTAEELSNNEVIQNQAIVNITGYPVREQLFFGTAEEARGKWDDLSNKTGIDRPHLAAARLAHHLNYDLRGDVRPMPLQYKGETDEQAILRLKDTLQKPITYTRVTMEPEPNIEFQKGQDKAEGFLKLATYLFNEYKKELTKLSQPLASWTELALGDQVAEQIEIITERASKADAAATAADTAYRQTEALAAQARDHASLVAAYLSQNPTDPIAIDYDSAAKLSLNVAESAAMTARLEAQQARDAATRASTASAGLSGSTDPNHLKTAGPLVYKALSEATQLSNNVTARLSTASQAANAVAGYAASVIMKSVFDHLKNNKTEDALKLLKDNPDLLTVKYDKLDSTPLTAALIQAGKENDPQEAEKLVAFTQKILAQSKEKIQEIEVFSTLINSLVSNKIPPNLQLDLSNCKLGNEHATILLAALNEPSFPQQIQLDLTGNTFSDSVSQALQTAIKDKPDLKITVDSFSLDVSMEDEEDEPEVTPTLSAEETALSISIGVQKKKSLIHNPNLAAELRIYAELADHYQLWSLLAKGSWGELDKLGQIKMNCRSLYQELIKPEFNSLSGRDDILKSLKSTYRELETLQKTGPDKTYIFCDRELSSSVTQIETELKSITNKEINLGHLRDCTMGCVSTGPSQSAFVQGIRKADGVSVSEAYITRSLNADQNKLREFVFDQIESFHADRNNLGMQIKFSGNFTKEYLVQAINYCNLRGYSWELDTSLKDKILNKASIHQKADLENLFNAQPNKASEQDWKAWLTANNKHPISGLVANPETVKDNEKTLKLAPLAGKDKAEASSKYSSLLKNAAQTPQTRRTVNNSMPIEGASATPTKPLSTNPLPSFSVSMSKNNKTEKKTEEDEVHASLGLQSKK